MKQFIVCISALIGFTGASAQVELSALDFQPEAEWKYILHGIDYMDPGDDGLEVIWDMSHALVKSSSAIRVISPEDSPFHSSFPNSTICYDYGAGNYIYASLDDRSYSRDGGVGGGVAIPHRDRQEIYHFPLLYGSSHMDAFSSEFKVETVPFQRVGKVTTEVVSQGTLIMPYGVIDDVIKVQVTEEFHDSYQILMDTVRSSTVNLSFHYLRKGIAESLLTLTVVSKDGVEVHRYGTMMEGNAVKEVMAEEAPLRAITIRTDSIEDQLNMRCISEWEGDMEMRIQDLNGDFVLESSVKGIAPGELESAMNISSLPPATYLLHLQVDGRKTMKKVVKD